MATTKKIWLGSLELTYANKAETEPEIETDVIKTFSGNITDGDDKPSWKISVDKVRYSGTPEEFIKVRKKIYDMMKNPGEVNLIEWSNMGNGQQVKVSELYYNCIVDSKKVTFDVETRTVENISFVATGKREWVNGQLTYESV